MKTRTYQVYKYSELPKEAQEKARQNWIDSDNLPFLDDFMNELCGELLEKNKIQMLAISVAKKKTRTEYADAQIKTLTN